MRRRARRDRNVLMGMVAGLAGGLAASFVMNQFQSAEQKIEKAVQKHCGHGQEQQQQNQGESAESEDSTMKTADRIAGLVLHHGLTHDQKKKAGPIVHYAFGTLTGGLYGTLAELVPAVRLGAGSAYGAAVFAFGDELALWKLGIAESPAKYPVQVHARSLASHLVYGLTTEAVRRGVRASG